MPAFEAPPRRGLHHHLLHRADIMLLAHLQRRPSVHCRDPRVPRRSNLRCRQPLLQHRRRHSLLSASLRRHPHPSLRSPGHPLPGTRWTAHQDIRVTADSNASQATVAVNGESFSQDQPSNPVVLNLGDNTVTITVGATYTIAANRGAGLTQTAYVQSLQY